VNLGTRLTKTGELAHLKTLGQVVADYKVRFDFSRASANHSIGSDDPVLDYARKAPSLRQAISRACLGRREDGKMFSKGSCVEAAARSNLISALYLRREQFKRAVTFEHVYGIVSSAQVRGIGPMMRYDVTSRIAAYLEIWPEHYAYLHAGPLVGYKNLTGYRGGPTAVAVKDLPPELRELKPHDIENLFCEYRMLLNKSMINGHAGRDTAE
jgi:hypothetical protein